MIWKNGTCTAMATSCGAICMARWCVMLVALRSILSLQIEDITSRKVAELALAESEERFRVSFEDAAIGMAIVLPDQEVVRSQSRRCAILGIPKRRLLGTKLARSHTRRTARATSISSLAPWRVSLPITKWTRDTSARTGEIVQARLCVSLLRHADGSPRYFLSQIQDITERMLAEAGSHARGAVAGGGLPPCGGRCSDAALFQPSA